MSRKIGNDYENVALGYLQRRGLKLVCRNFYSRCGEIDLIMQDKNALVFVEVRYRRSSLFGKSEETVNYYKQQRIIKAAHYYLLKFPQNREYRFDVLAINHQNTQSIHWIQNAFTL